MMVYGKEYKIIKNFREYEEEETFEEELSQICKKHNAILFINETEVEFK